MNKVMPEKMVEYIQLILGNFSYRYIQILEEDNLNVEVNDQGLFWVETNDEDDSHLVQISCYPHYWSDDETGGGLWEVFAAIIPLKNKGAKRERKIKVEYEDWSQLKRKFPEALEKVCEIF